MSTNTWTHLARQHGRRCAVSLTITDEEYDALTARQSAALIDMLRPHLRGDEQRALDYGCGAARLTPMLHELLLHPEPFVWGYDPCPEMLHLAPHAPERPLILTSSWPIAHKFDLVLMAMVLGDPECKIGMAIHDALSVLAPGGLFVLLEHTRQYPKPGTWWQFRSAGFYQGLLNSYDVRLDLIGTIAQLENPVSVFAGRRKR